MRIEGLPIDMRIETIWVLRAAGGARIMLARGWMHLQTLWVDTQCGLRTTAPRDTLNATHTSTLPNAHAVRWKKRHSACEQFACNLTQPVQTSANKPNERKSRHQTQYDTVTET